MHEGREILLVEYLRLNSPCVYYACFHCDDDAATKNRMRRDREEQENAMLNVRRDRPAPRNRPYSRALTIGNPSNQALRTLDQRQSLFLSKSNMKVRLLIYEHVLCGDGRPIHLMVIDNNVGHRRCIVGYEKFADGHYGYGMPGELYHGCQHSCWGCDSFNWKDGSMKSVLQPGSRGADLLG